MKFLKYLSVCVLLMLAQSAHSAEASLQWSPPQFNVDGSVADDLAGYRVYARLNASSFSQVSDLGNPNLTSATIAFSLPGLTAGENIVDFVMTAYDVDGNESGYSNQVTSVITVLDDVAPNEPEIITITITVAVDCPAGKTCSVSSP